MSWLNRVRNSIPFLPKRETPDNLWHKCRHCGAMVFTKEWEENDFVCPRCDHHGRMGARSRLEHADWNLRAALEGKECPDNGD